MSKEKPLGMRIGESVFCAGYLIFAAIASARFLACGDGPQAPLACVCALMTLLLGCGDAFHLVPRILGNLRGAATTDSERQARTWWLGLGNLVSSITMTLFYLLLYWAMWIRDNGTQTPPATRIVVFVVLALLAVLRIALCLSPENHWFDGQGTIGWALRRNAPFVAMGIITVLCLVGWYHAWLLAALVTVSFACYLAVVLLARRRPAMGMLMIPKTVCYIWMVALFLLRM